MRRHRLSLFLVLALAGLAFTASSVRAEPCTIKLNVHNHAWIVLKHKKLAQCTSGAAGCKCVACWNADHSASAVCFALVAPAPGK